MHRHNCHCSKFLEPKMVSLSHGQNTIFVPVYHPIFSTFLWCICVSDFSHNSTLEKDVLNRASNFRQKSMDSDDIDSIFCYISSLKEFSVLCL